jgi:anti-anti-sigma regulatory factor
MRDEGRQRLLACLSQQLSRKWVKRMAMTAVFLNVDEALVVPALREAGQKLDGTEGEVTLDFSSVLRIDSSAIRALEELARIAEGKNVKVALRGVNVEVYKVLKLVKLTRRLSFVN